MYLDPICTYTLTRLCPRFLKGLIRLSSKTALYFLPSFLDTSFCERESHYILHHHLLLLWHLRICSNTEGPSSSWPHQGRFVRKTLDNNHLNRLCRPAVLVKTRVWVGYSVSRAHKTWSRSFWLGQWLGLGTNAWIRRFQDGGCSTLYSPISTQIASTSSARGFFYSVDIFFYIFS